MQQINSPEPRGPAASAEVYLRDWWCVLSQRRRLIGAVTAAMVLLSAIFSYTRTPLYKASAVLQISPGGKVNLVDDRTIEETRIRYEEFFATQQAILRSRTLAQRVIDELKLAQHPRFNRESGLTNHNPHLEQEQTDALLEMLSVSPIGRTQLVEIGFVTPQAELSARLTNALARQYVNYSAEALSGVARNTSDFIRGQIEKLQLSIKEKAKLLRDYSEQEDLLIVDERANIGVQQLEEMSKRLTQVQAERAQAWAHYSSLQNQDVNSIPDILNNGTIQDLKREKARLQQRYSELSGKFKANYPDMQRMGKALEEVEQRLEQETTYVANQAIAAARVRYETALHEEALLEGVVEEQRQRTRDENTLAAEYQRIKVELDNERAVLERLLMRESATGLDAELGARQSMTVRLVDEAVVPTERYSPKHKLNLLLGGFLGMALSIGLALLSHARDAAIHTAEDIRRVGLPYLGSFPHEDSSDGTQRPAGMGSSERAKLLALLLLCPGVSRKTVLVTSSTQAEGKTFVASRLATCVTRLGKKVLLVDADLRSPSLQNVFQLHYGVGLSSVLKGDESVDNGCIPSTEVPGLYMMLSGPPTSVPSELLSSPAMENLLSHCTEQFDLVVLDGAPLLPVVDSHALVHKCDTIVLVTRSGYTRREMIRAAKGLIESENGKIAGVVLNDVDVGDHALNDPVGDLVFGYGYESEPVNGSWMLRVWKSMSTKL